MDPNALHLLLAGSLIISIAANILLGSRVAHYRALYVKWNNLASEINNNLSMSQKEFVDMRAKRTMMAEAYKHKDRECEVLRSQKSEINAKYNALVKTIKQVDEREEKYIPHQFTSPVTCKCGSGKPYLVSKDGKVHTFCVDCEPF